MSHKYFCPNCGSPVLSERWKAGYEYCMEKRCFEALGRRHSQIQGAEWGEVSPLELDDISDHYDNDRHGD